MVPAIEVFTHWVLHPKICRSGNVWILSGRIHIRILILVMALILSLVWVHRLVHCFLLLFQVDEMIVLGTILRTASVCTSVKNVPKDLPPFIDEALRSVHCHFRLWQTCLRIQQIELIDHFLAVLNYGHVCLFEKGGGRRVETRFQQEVVDVGIE